MSMQEQYAALAGESATYRKEGADYHTLRYVRWLESRLAELRELYDLDTQMLKAERDDSRDALAKRTRERDGLMARLTQERNDCDELRAERDALQDALRDGGAV